MPHPPTSLKNENLALLRNKAFCPNYNRGELTPGIVHIGVGNFHRAHQSWYLHRLMQNGDAHDWAIIGAGVRPYDVEMRLNLQKQDYLSTLIELDPEGMSVEIVGSMIGYLPVETDNGALIAQMCNPEIRIVSLTVTEGGYYVQSAGGGFDHQHADIMFDVQNPRRPRTAFGAIVEAFRLRRQARQNAFTVLSCDNLHCNGEVARQTILGLAELIDPDLAAWINAKATFPNSMVDCIVPASGAEASAQAAKMGIADPVVVTHENFRQWVLEDKFCAGRPNWQEAGVTFSEDVLAFESQKIRILNAGHQIVANSAELLGLELISTAMQNDLIRKLFNKIQVAEIIPHVAPVSGLTPAQYVKLVEKRFLNPSVKDTVRRVCFDGSSRHPGFVLPSLRDALVQNTAISGLAFAEAAWAKMCLGRRENGSEIAPNDPSWDTLKTCAQRAVANPCIWLEQQNIYGDLVENTRFRNAFCKWFQILATQGVNPAIQSYLKGG